MKIRRSRDQVSYDKIRREVCIERPQEFFLRMSPFKIKCSNLPRRVDSRVCSPGHDDRPPRPTQIAERSFQLALHCAGVRLNLASGKTGAVVGKDHLVTCHKAVSPCGDFGLIAKCFLLFHQFQNDHLSRVTVAGSELHHAGVTAGAICKARGDLVEQALDDLVVA